MENNIYLTIGMTLGIIYFLISTANVIFKFSNSKWLTGLTEDIHNLDIYDRLYLIIANFLLGWFVMFSYPGIFVIWLVRWSINRLHQLALFAITFMIYNG